MSNLLTFPQLKNGRAKMIQPCRNPELMILTTTLNSLEKDPGKDCTEQSCLFRSRGRELNQPKYLVVVY